MKSGLRRSLGFIAVALVLPVSFGLAANKEAGAKSVQAQLLDHNEYPCSGCFFGATQYYVCFKAGDKILIARQKIPTMNYQDSSQNYLTKPYKRWMPWKSDGATVNLKYDDKYIWLPGPNGKDIRMAQDYTRDIFMDSRECRAAVKK